METELKNSTDSGELQLNQISTEKDNFHQYGNVTLVGFGPGDPDLLTIAGDKALAKAQVIFHDDLVDQAFLDKYTGE